MTKKYNQLNLEQRYKIEAYLAAGESQTAISKLLGVHKSTISRELKRNVPKRGIGANHYVATKANLKTQNRHKQKSKHTTLTYSLKLQMQSWITEKKYSPELVSAEWEKQNIAGVSHECIYKFIWHCKHTNQKEGKQFKFLYKQLKHGKRRRKRGNYKDTRGLIPNRVSIERRPKIVEKRNRWGDIEVDLIMGKNHKSALLVTVDGATLMATIDKVKSKNATIVSNKIVKRMKKSIPLRTMTFDNDQAFAKHEEIAKRLRLKTYFTRPYTSQDKGTIENRNGIIRLFFPKKTDFNLISEQEIKRVENLINNRPVRKFGYLTPKEVFSQRKVSVALIS